MGIGFAPAITRGGHFHQPRVERVLNVALEDAILDQGGALGGIALVIDVQGTATVSDSAVINNGNAFGGDTLTNTSGESAGSFAIKVAFQTVTDRFMQQYTRPARS